MKFLEGMQSIRGLLHPGSCFLAVCLKERHNLCSFSI